MELFHFDIETCGQWPDYRTFLENDERGAKLFESKWKRMGWHAKFELEDSYREQCAAMSTYGKICCISFGYMSDDKQMIKSFAGKDERQIVSDFNDLLKKIEKKDFAISGFRIVNFDIPWVLHKLHKYGIEPAAIIRPYNKKPWDMRIVDMSDDWKQKFGINFSFDEMCHELGIDSPKDEMNGYMVHDAYWSGDIEKIKRYCEKDVSASLEAGLKLYGKEY